MSQHSKRNSRQVPGRFTESLLRESEGPFVCGGCHTLCSKKRAIFGGRGRLRCPACGGYLDRHHESPSAAPDLPAPD